ncbi:MAG: TRAP transporter small permease [Pseudomonadota bacterium]
MSVLDAITVEGSRWLARIAGAMVLFSAILVAAEVILRNLFGIVALYSFELTIYLFAIAVAMALPHALAQRAHIRIDIVYATLPLSVRAVLDVAALGAMVGVAGLFARHAFQTASTSYSLGARSNDALQVPMALPQGVWALALSWFAVVAFILLIQALADLSRSRYGMIAARAGVPSADFLPDDEGGDGAR